MSDPYDVPSSERGAVRLFTTDLDAEGNSAITSSNVHLLLGEDLDLDPRHIEVFPSTVIEAMGLSAYLSEGYGIPEADLQGTSVKLDGLKGLLILIASAAFKAQKAMLAPADSIRFVGMFQEPGMAPPKPMTAPDTSGGHLNPGGEELPANISRRSVWPVAVVALIGAAALILLLAL